MKSEIRQRVIGFNSKIYSGVIADNELKLKSKSDLDMIENILDSSISLINTIDEMFLFFQQNLQKLRQKIIKTSIVKLPPDDMDSGVENIQNSIQET
jgi:hypothetical protein